MVAILVDTKDAKEAEGVFTETYALTVSPLHRQPPDFYGRLQRSRVGSIFVDEIYLGVDCRFQRHPSDDILLTRIHSGVVRASQGDSSSDVFTAGDVAAIGAAGDRAVTGTSCGAAQHYTVVSINRRALDAAACMLAAGSPRVELLGQAPVSGMARRRMANAIDYVSEMAVTDPAGATDPLVAGSLQQHLAAIMLTTFPHRALHAEDDEVMPPPLVKAIAYIERHVDTDITIAGVAKAVHTSPRSLQLMFRKYRDCTPMQHLRDVRMQRAHSDLVAADSRSTSVARVAMRWGFGHSGRFAVRYRECFGESPSATLHRSPAVDRRAETEVGPLR